MKNLLVVNASPQSHPSHSREMTQRFITQWQASHPKGSIVYRELGGQPIPHVDEHWIDAAFTPAEQRTPAQRETLALSDELVEELQAADCLLMGVPMYNLSIPSTLKAYIDQIIRMGVTTSLVPETPRSPYLGKLHGKKAYLMLSRGGYGYNPNGSYAHLNFQDNYLVEVLNMLGITDITRIALEYTAIGGDALQQALREAQQRIDQLSL
ncbi:FMN-dependent NADH-azoreductase [Pokkaliibacter sp. CJK22405]|uniref:FMN-dependent NADH-azoreductase n=1 Tax=Pokkaliibacter sp. CJK22405 TaxID=3384615 RepID=UPI003984AA8E